MLFSNAAEGQDEYFDVMLAIYLPTSLQTLFGFII